MSEPAKGEGQRCTGSMSLCDEEDASFFHLFLGLLLELRFSVHPLPHLLPGRAEAWGLCCVEDSEDKGTSLFPPFLPPNKHESDVLRTRDVCAGVCGGGCYTSCLILSGEKVESHVSQPRGDGARPPLGIKKKVGRELREAIWYAC